MEYSDFYKICIDLYNEINATESIFKLKNISFEIKQNFVHKNSVETAIMLIVVGHKDIWKEIDTLYISKPIIIQHTLNTYKIKDRYFYSDYVKYTEYLKRFIKEYEGDVKCTIG